MTDKPAWMATEAAMVAEWMRRLQVGGHLDTWTPYPESCGWDLILAHKDGRQIGIEAKLALNPKVVAQSLKGVNHWYGVDGPDYRAVLVPSPTNQGFMDTICDALGIRVITMAETQGRWECQHHINLPTGEPWCKWPHWGPQRRCALPDYIPDVQAGRPSPLQLTDWKVKAIKLDIVLSRRGYVTRDDLRALKISPTRWLGMHHAFLTTGAKRGQYVRYERTPNFRAEHPINYEQIAADASQWGAVLDPEGKVAPDWLLPPA